MPGVTSPAETTQLAAAAVASDFGRVMATAEEALAETLSRAWNEAQEAIARDLANTMADVDARFEEIARTTRVAVGPGTVIGDFLTLSGERTTQSEQEAALERFAHTLGLTRLMRHVSKGGLCPRAQQALRLISRDTGVPKQEILRREIPGALFDALAAFHGDQTRRDGRNWRKDGSGRKLRFIPTETYTIPDLPQGRGRAHFRDLARRCLGTVLLKAAGLTDFKSSKSRAKPLTVHAREIAQLLCSPSPEHLLLEMTALDDRRQTAIALSAKSLARLSPRERQLFPLPERTNQEIATTMGIKEVTVRGFKARIRKKLMPIVGQKFGTRQK